MNGDHSQFLDFTRKSLIAIGIAAAAVLIIAGVIKTFEVLLLIYAGILLAVFMRGTSNVVAKYTHLPVIMGLIILWLILIAAIIVIPWQFGPNVAADFNDLFTQIPKSIDRLRQWAGDWQWAQRVLNQVANGGANITSTVVKHAMGIFSTVLGGLSGFLLMLVLGLYFSITPQVYVNGLIKLIPRSRRKDGREILKVAGHTLFGWVLTRLVAMVSVGVLSYIGLLVLGVRQPLTLAMVAGVFTAVEYLGPIVSAVPAILVALGQYPMLALYTVILYLLVHLVEGYFITPFVQWRFISMPPALVLSAQVLMGLGAGIIGVILASPLVVMIRVLAELLYVRDALHDEKVPLNPKPHQ
jgi:predicted PurR-regulated permease PerM